MLFETCRLSLPPSRTHSQAVPFNKALWVLFFFFALSFLCFTLSGIGIGSLRWHMSHVSNEIEPVGSVSSARAPRIFVSSINCADREISAVLWHAATHAQAGSRYPGNVIGTSTIHRVLNITFLRPQKFPWRFFGCAVATSALRTNCLVGHHCHRGIPCEFRAK